MKTTTPTLQDAIAWGAVYNISPREIIRRRIHHGAVNTINSSYGKGNKSSKRVEKTQSATWKEVLQSIEKNYSPNTPPSTWTTCPEWFYQHMLDAMPPLYFKGGFAMSEPHSHDDRGAVYICLRKTPTGYECALSSLALAA